MDGYYRAPVSAGYYASSRYPTDYGVEGRSLYTTHAAEPLYSTYTRAPLDAYAGYGTPVAYQQELIPLPQYSAPVQFLSPRRRTNPTRRLPAQNNGKRRPSAPAEGLTPKKKPFKKTQKVLPVANFSPKGSGVAKRKPLHKEQKDADKQKNAGKVQKSIAATLAKETEELHSLFRTGVDPSTGKKIVKPISKLTDASPAKKNNVNSAGQKRKADEQKKGGALLSRKKSRGKKNKRAAKEKKQEAKKDEKPVEVPKAVKVEPAPLTEEQKRQIEVALELQSAACKAVAVFLGIPEKKAEPEPEVEKSAEPEPEAEKSESTQAAADEAPAEVQDKVDAAPKPSPTLTPEEEKELEEKAFNFFSKMLDENTELQKLYLDKKDSGTFECLVCHSVDAETSKKFANLTSLVMHTSMRKQKRPEHRGYGKAVCDILGWESFRAPKRPAKQAKDDGESVKPVDTEKTIEVETEKNQEGTTEK